MASEMNTVLRKKDEIFTLADIAVTANVLTVTVPALGAGNRGVIVGMFLGNTTGGAGAEIFRVTGAAKIFEATYAVTVDKEILIPISGDALNTALVVLVQGTTLTTGFLIVSYKIQREV